MTQENEYEPFPFKRSPHQTPYPSRDHTPETFPLSTSPSEPKKTAVNAPEPEPPISEPLETSMKLSPAKEALEKGENSEEVQQPPSLKAEMSPSSYKCYYCQDKFSKMSIRMEHMRNEHSNRTKGWAGAKPGRPPGNL